MSGNDLYVPATYSSRSYARDQYSHQPYSHHPDSSDNASNDDLADSPNPKSSDQPSQKSETKPQATFLTKLYALLERTENHHMIRWDPQGEHIVVERPEQLALHVLPSIYRQSRFASFSRQLNIYGFMRKVNLRNVDPAIDDPDASTWSHPTLNRHSPPEVVANFKRRVPPRLPKPRKRDPQDSPSIPAPRSAVGMGPVPLTVPSSVGPSTHKPSHIGRPRGFSSPGAFPPIIQNSAGGSSWSNGGYSRATLPPLTVPSDQGSMYHHSSHPLNPLTPSDDSPTSPAFNSMPSYSTSSSQYPYQDQNHWSSQNSSYSSHNGSLSSLLNPSSGGYSRPPPPPSINTSYTSSPFSSMPMEHSASSMSPDSRPTTGYSMSSVGSMSYGDDYSRPNSSHHRPISPSRPPSSKGSYSSNSLIVRRGRRHSQAMSPYPSPYESPAEQRPSTSPQPIDEHHGSSLPRVRSMIQLPSVEQYSFSGHQPEFAYSAVPGAVGSTTSIDSLNDSSSWHAQRSGRPSTAASSISAASHTSSSQANTPPVQDYHGDTDINRYSPDEHHFGFVAMNEHLPQQYSKSPNEM